MPLDPYRQKRSPSHSPEPSGAGEGGSPGWRFVVQKHAARRLHYDLRLELGGVLKSWAVPKGPCLDPAEKRLAVHVEDHPVEYLEFEDVIPAGQYGAGAMIVWDRGAWAPEGDGEAEYRAGQLKFRLHGEKLRGRWMLVRMKPKPGERGDNWLLIKERDEEARPLSEYDVLEVLPESVKTGRTTEDLAAGREPGRRGEQPRFDVSKIEGAVAAKPPASIRLQLAESAGKPPAGDRWLHEIKFDGYRIVGAVEDRRATVTTRSGQDWTQRFPHLAAALGALPARSAILDGELVALLPDGTSSFQALQTALSEGRAHTLVYFAFDVLYLDGYDLRKVPLETRKELLAELLHGGGTEIRYTDHLVGDGPAFFSVCRERGLEGMISKRRDRPHRPGRASDWLKSKCLLREEFVIGGFTEPDGTREGLGAVLVGYFDGRGRLVYAGKVGTGFDRRTLLELRTRLEAIEQRKNPFIDLPRERIDRGTRWVKPCLVAQIEYGNWTGDRLLRHPSFQGLRDDMPAAAVVRGAPSKAAEMGIRLDRGREPPPPERRQELSPGQLDALASVRITSPERVLYPRPGITKLDLIKFYVEIADWILPHVTGRALSLVRCPEGVGGSQRFFQKHATAGTPEAIKRVRVRAEKADFLAIDDLAGVAALVQMGVLEIHPWGSRVDRPEKPDRMIFDLDPGPGVDWPAVIAGARALHHLLDELGLASFVKTTGGKGLHVLVPLARRNSWDEVQAFSRAVAKRVSAASPGRYTLSMAKAARTGRIYIDCLRNARGATAVAAYSTRANDNATVSVPLGWEELSPHVGPDHFTVQNLGRRLAALERDPWAGMDDAGTALTAGMRKQVKL